MKVRLLYFAHLYNIPLSPELEEDLAVILQKIPLLHGELISKTFIMERISEFLFIPIAPVKISGTTSRSVSYKIPKRLKLCFKEVISSEFQRLKH